MSRAVKWVSKCKKEVYKRRL